MSRTPDLTPDRPLQVSQPPVPVKRHRVLIRVLSLLQKLETGRHRLAPLATEFSVHPRTILRDLHALEEAGVPLEHDVDLDTGEGIWWLFKLRSNRESRSFPTTLSDQHATFGARHSEPDAAGDWG